MARKIKRPAPYYSVIDGGASASDPYDFRKDKGIYGPKRRSKVRPVPIPQYQPRRKDVPA